MSYIQSSYCFFLLSALLSVTYTGVGERGARQGQFLPFRHLVRAKWTTNVIILPLRGHNLELNADRNRCQQNMPLVGPRVQFITMTILDYTTVVVKISMQLIMPIAVNVNATGARSGVYCRSQPML